MDQSFTTVHPDLGAPEAEYRTPHRDLIGPLILCAALMLAFGISALVAGPGAASARFWSGVGSMGLLAFFFFYPALRYTIGLRVLLYRDGIVHSRFGRSRTIQWGDVAYLQQCSGRNKFLPDHLVIGLHNGTRINLAGEDRLKHPQQFPGAPMAIGLRSLIYQVSERVQPHLEHHAREQIWEGKTVFFGNLGVSREGLQRGRRRIAWADIETMDNIGPHLVILVRGTRSAWGIFTLPLRRNALILVPLIEQTSRRRIKYVDADQATRSVRLLRRRNQVGSLLFILVIFGSPILLIISLFAYDYYTWRHNPRDQIRAGYSSLRSGEIDAAHDFFERALRLEPGAPPALCGLGSSQRRLGAFAAAEDSLRACAETTTDPQLRSFANAELELVAARSTTSPP